jgi:hypothetical protein
MLKRIQHKYNIDNANSKLHIPHSSINTCSVLHEAPFTALDMSKVKDMINKFITASFSDMSKEQTYEENCRTKFRANSILFIR